MVLKLITAPLEMPVTREEAKRHLRIEHDDENDLIDIYIAAATAYVDGRNGVLHRALRQQIWELTLDAFPCSAIEIPLPPLFSIDSVKYDDAAGDEQTVDAANYYVDTVSEPGWVVPISTFSWPTTLVGANTVRIRFTAGYTEVDSVDNGVPKGIIAAMLLIIGDMNENRESVTPGQANKIPVPTSAMALLHQYMIHAFA